MTESNDFGGVKQLHILVDEMTRLEFASTSDEILDYICAAAVKLLDADMAWILSPDLANDRLIVKAALVNNKIDVLDITLPIHASQEGWVFLNQQPVTINDMKEFNGVNGPVINIPGVEIKSCMIFPILIKKKAAFVLEIANIQDVSFIEFDQNILTSYLMHAALWLEKSQGSLQSALLPELIHELRTPLASLNTALQLLQRPTLPVAKREQISEMIQAEFTRLTDLITSFLDYARLESGRVKYHYSRFDLKVLLIEAVDIIQMQLEGKDFKFTVNVPGEPLYLDADRDKIKQVLLNLLTNAVKYDHTGGKICLDASHTSTTINFSVTDDGPGIPTEFIPRIFERFFRVPNTERQVKGTGLGLPISKHIIEAHHGKIEIKSNLGQGTTVTVSLPTNQ